MWEINNGFQLFGFVQAAFLGGMFCLLYDALRATRKIKAHSDIAVFIEDVAYFTVIAPICFCYFLALTNGEVRAYIFVAVAVGFCVARVTVSFVFIKIFIFVFSAGLKIFLFFKKLFYGVFMRFETLCNGICRFMTEKSKKIANSFKKLLKKG